MRMLLKAVLDTEAANEVFPVAQQQRHSIGSKKPCNRKSSTASLRTESARSLQSSTWRTRRKSP